MRKFIGSIFILFMSVSYCFSQNLHFTKRQKMVQKPKIELDSDTISKNFIGLSYMFTNYINFESAVGILKPNSSRYFLTDETQSKFNLNLAIFYKRLLNKNNAFQIELGHASRIEENFNTQINSYIQIRELFMTISGLYSWQFPISSFLSAQWSYGLYTNIRMVSAMVSENRRTIPIELLMPIQQKAATIGQIIDFAMNCKVKSIRRSFLTGKLSYSTTTAGFRTNFDLAPINTNQYITWTPYVGIMYMF
jgi:hypothetical protein